MTDTPEPSEIPRPTFDPYWTFAFTDTDAVGTRLDITDGYGRTEHHDLTTAEAGESLLTACAAALGVVVVDKAAIARALRRIQGCANIVRAERCQAGDCLSCTTEAASVFAALGGREEG